MAPSCVLVAMEWMAEGNCNNHPPAVFFPSDGVGVEVAKKICGTCPVQERMSRVRAAPTGSTTVCGAARRSDSVAGSSSHVAAPLEAMS